jgi:hypothetical protein
MIRFIESRWVCWMPSILISTYLFSQNTVGLLSYDISQAYQKYLDVSILSTGVYFVKIHSGYKEGTTRLIIP